MNLNSRHVVDIMSALSRSLDFITALEQIAEITGLPKTTISPILSKLKKLRIVTNPERGFWKLLRVFRKIRHTKRIVETSQSKKRREWNCDCEGTSVGFVPYTGLPLPPGRPHEAITKKYARIINPKLEREIIATLGRTDPPIILQSFTTTFEPTCSPHLVQAMQFPKFCIEGTEWLPEITGEFEGTHEVEVVFVNDLGVFYTFYSSFSVSEAAFR